VVATLETCDSFFFDTHCFQEGKKKIKTKPSKSIAGEKIKGYF
jgi:hypothetical protein